MARTISAILNLKDNFSNKLKTASGNTKQFQRQLKQTGNAVKTMQSSIVGSFAKLTGDISLLEVGKQSLMLASDLQEVQNVVDTTFGDSSNKINEWSKNALQSFGLSELTAKKFNGTLGAMLKTSGFTGDQLTEMSTGLSGLAGDIASFKNLQPEEAFNKLRSVINGSSEPVEDLGLDFRVASLQAYALSKGITKQWKDMSNAEQIQIRYNYTMERTKDLQGDFAKTGSSFAGSLRVAGERIKEVGGKLGSIFLPIATVVLHVFNNMLSVVPSVADELQGLFSRLSNATDTADVFYLISECLNDVLFTLLPRNVATAFSDIYESISEFIIQIIDNSIRIAKDLVEPFKATIESVRDFMCEIIQTISDLFVGISSNLDLSGIFNVVRDVLGGLLLDIQGIFNFFTSNWSLIAPIIMGVGGAILFFNGAMKVVALTTKIVEAAQTSWAIATKVCNTAMGILNGTIAISPLYWIAAVIGLVIAAGVALWQNWDYVSAKAQELWNWLTTSFTGIGDSISAIFHDLGSGVSDFVNGAIDGLNSLIEGFNALTGISIPDWIPGLGGKTFDLNIPTIPNFATGTQYFKGGLAEMNEHGGEMAVLPNGSKVIPADKTDKLMSSGSSPVINLTIQGNVIGNKEFINDIGSTITNQLKLALI